MKSKGTLVKEVGNAYIWQDPDRLYRVGILSGPGFKSKAEAWQTKVAALIESDLDEDAFEDAVTDLFC
jgi:hypothetical protein